MRWQLSKSISKCTFTKECGQVHGFRQVLNSNSLCLLTSFWLVYCILHIAHDKWLVFRMRCQGEQPLQIIFILLCSLPFSFVAKDWCTLIRTKHSSKTLLRLVQINVYQSLLKDFSCTIVCSNVVKVVTSVLYKLEILGLEIEEFVGPRPTSLVFPSCSPNPTDILPLQICQF